jgi:hypothetical protein
MDTKDLFDACSEECIWCREQWPVLEFRGAIVHVAPFTKDPLLFRYPCSAASIRKGLKYMGFDGGIEIKWTLRKPEEVMAIARDYWRRASGKLGKNVGSPKNRAFWRNAVECSIRVSGWPEWKRGNSGASTPAELKRMRSEIIYYDEMDYWTRQACTESQQYRPGFDSKGALIQPTCNYGFGCTTCWSRYENQYNEITEDCCY